MGKSFEVLYVGLYLIKFYYVAFYPHHPTACDYEQYYILLAN